MRTWKNMTFTSAWLLALLWLLLVISNQAFLTEALQQRQIKNNHHPKQGGGSRFQIRQKVKTVASKLYRPIHNTLWPTATTPANNNNNNNIPLDQLPPGPMGCPFRGFNPRQTDPTYGPGILFVKLFEQLKRPSVFKFYSNPKRGSKSGTMIAVVSGVANSKALLSQEFDALTSQVVTFSREVIGPNSLRCSQDKHDHAQLRKLVGMAVQPSRVSQLIPDMYKTAHELILDVITKQEQSSATIAVESLTMRYTLLVACRHIIGLTEQDIPMSEFEEFQQQAITWVTGIYDQQKSDWRSARAYLVEKIEHKLDYLREHGPDASTLSGMLFAKDDDDDHDDDDSTSKKSRRHRRRQLTQDEIIDNTLMLILAGSETSAGTLVNCILCLGLNQQHHNKLLRRQRQQQQEQSTAGTTTTSSSNTDEMSALEYLQQEHDDLMQQYGSDASLLNRTILDQAIYTQGIIKESLRIKPVIGGSMRGTKSTITIDGYTIPAGWGIAYDRYNTHLMDPVTQMPNNAHMDVFNGFDPKRWIVSSSSSSSSSSSLQQQLPQEFIPFGAGPRYCIGADMAMCEMQVFLTALARTMPHWDLISPSIIISNNDDDNHQQRTAAHIEWKEKSIIPIPKGGVVIQPRST